MHYPLFLSMLKHPPFTVNFNLIYTLLEELPMTLPRLVYPNNLSTNAVVKLD